MRKLSLLPVLWALLFTLYIRESAASDPALVKSVDAVAVTVADAERSAKFFEQVLTFTRESDQELSGEDIERRYGVFGARVRIIRERLGDERIELIQFLAPTGRPIPVDSKSNDRWFQHVAIIVSDMDKAYARLRSFNVQHASTGPQLLPNWNPNAGGISAFYFKDADGHNLEILHFPKGKGDAKWQRSDKLFLGIDHTAIVVDDTDASLKFYRDALGLRIAGTSDNYGTEQAHLNNVFGAHLRITALRAETGPGVELLEYITPKTGREFPIDTQSNDLWHWHVDMSADVVRAEQVVRAGHYREVSTKDRGPAASVLVRDPDGHAMQLKAH